MLNASIRKISLQVANACDVSTSQSSLLFIFVCIYSNVFFLVGRCLLFTPIVSFSKELAFTLIFKYFESSWSISRVLLVSIFDFKVWSNSDLSLLLAKWTLVMTWMNCHLIISTTGCKYMSIQASVPNDIHIYTNSNCNILHVVLLKRECC